MGEHVWILTPIFFLIALLYASVGLGGGSGYVALLYLFGFPLSQIPPLALFFNIIASSIALYRFQKGGYVVPRLILPFLMASIPATFIGSRWKPDEKILSLIFAIVLFSIALILLFRKREVRTKFSLDKRMTWVVSLCLGAALGFLAGIMGIGGGIFLGPVLLVAGFASPRHVAGICSAFVFVNSVVGLTSYAFQGRIDASSLLFLGLAVFFGAQTGSFLGSRKFSPLVLQRIFSFLLLIVSFKLGAGILE